MYEEYYGFAEKPFSLTPDPKYLFKSESHANAFELLQYAVRRREGFVVVTGDIGTGKTTLCRAFLEEIDRNTFTALVLNPFLSEDDLLKLILQDFGVVSRDDVKRGRLNGVSKTELIEWITQYLTSGKRSEPIMRNGWGITISGPAAEGIPDPNERLGAAVMVEMKK